MKIGDKIIFSTSKGALKTGIVKDVKDILHQDEYNEVYTIELENGKLLYVDLSHILQKIEK